MLLHDANDVLMEASKLCNYWQLKRAASGMFAAFVAAWAVLRLGCGTAAPPSCCSA
jgi:hypothetical protein